MLRLFGIVILSFGLVGCAVTQKRTDLDALQMRVVDLEKRIEEKDMEIVDLKYEVKDLSTQLENKRVRVQESAPAVEAAPVSAATGEIIRVSASAVDVQNALKNAGFYNGNVDGKVGPKTKKAIQDFQRSRNLTADGVVGKKTWEELRTYLD